MKKLVIQQSWGGLGDNLQFSTLPELLSNHGVEVFVSTNNAYRNLEIKELVWDKNPYVVDYVHPDEINADLVLGFGNEFTHQPPGWIGSIINKWEEIATTTLIGQDIRTNGFAKVYYTPSLESKVSEDYVFLDFTATATRGDYDYEKYWDVVFSRHGDHKIIVPKMTKLPNCEPILPENKSVEVVDINSIYEYIDCLSHSKKFYTVFSGMNTLAPAFHEDITTFMPNRYQQGKLIKEHTCDYIFDGVEYYAWWENQ